MCVHVHVHVCVCVCRSTDLCVDYYWPEEQSRWIDQPEPWVVLTVSQKDNHSKEGSAEEGGGGVKCTISCLTNGSENVCLV